MRQFWDERARENAAFYVDTTMEWDNPDMDAFLRAGERVVERALDEGPAQPAAMETALEIGAGLGRNCRALAQRFDRVIGLDISQEMVTRAQSVVSEPNVELRVSDGVGLAGIDDESIDFVLSFTVFQHLVHQQIVTGYLAEAARVLRPGGMLAVQWNNRPALRYRLETARLRLRGRIGVGDDQRQRDHAAFRGTTVRRGVMSRTLEKAGLVVEGTDGEGTLFAWIWASKPRGDARSGA